MKKFKGAAVSNSMPLTNAFLACALALFASRALAADSSEIKERLNRIFYWQIADELKLSAKTEKEMVAIVGDIQKKRDQALSERQSALDELKGAEKNLSGKVADPILKKYQSALDRLAKLDSEEHERLRALLGSESLAKFYLVRESVSTRIRDALKNGEGAAKAPAK